MILNTTKMNSVSTYKTAVHYVSGSPVPPQNESGYGSMQRTVGNPIQDDHSDRSSCLDYSFKNATGTGYGKRTKTANAETIKRRLFTSSPYVPEGKEQQRLSYEMSALSPIGNVTKDVKEKLNVRTPEKELLPKCSDDSPMWPGQLSMEESDSENEMQSPVLVDEACMEPPKCPASPYVKFYFTPMKDTKLFRNPTPSPLKSDIPATETRKTPDYRKRWLSFNIPEKRRDFLKKLEQMQMTCLLSNILSRLSEKDIFRVSCVSKAWRKIVLSDVDARKKRKNYIRRKITTKENRRKAQNRESTLSTNLTDGDREILMDLCNKRFPNLSFPKAPIAKSDCFLEVAKSIPKSEVILKCPVCQYPAKCVFVDRFRCVMDSCSYEFCRMCLGCHAPTVDCQGLRTLPKVIIGSKRSKNNLRRL